MFEEKDVLSAEEMTLQFFFNSKSIIKLCLSYIKNETKNTWKSLKNNKNFCVNNCRHKVVNIPDFFKSKENG